MTISIISILSMKKIIRLPVFVFISTVITINIVHSQTTDTYGPIKSGEMLWNIAGKVRPNTAITRYQAMLALLRANPHAFDVSCNINSLRVGQILDIPSGDEMQAMSHSDAVKAFNRQSEEWKAYRRRKEQIVCPPLPQQEKPEAKLPEPKLRVIDTPPQKAVPVITQNTADSSTITAVPRKESAKVVTNSSEVTAPQDIIVSEPATTFSSLMKPVLSWLAIPLLSLIIIALLILTIIILIVLLIARRRQSKKAAATQNHLLHEQIDNKSLPRQHHEIKAHNRMNSSLTSTNQEGLDPIVNPHTHDMKEKLDRVRSYLAENEAQTAQNTLREVIHKGTPEQQEEAKQLYEINKKINFLKQNVAKDKPMSLSSQSDNPAWQEIVHHDKHWPTQQYLPENREQVFDLIDKIVDLLDYELNAQGQLVDAYVNRHRQDFLKGQNYEIVEKPEKVVIDEEEEPPLRKPQSESKPTRYL